VYPQAADGFARVYGAPSWGDTRHGLTESGNLAPYSRHTIWQPRLTPEILTPEILKYT
jgi:hypothetical protein